MAASSLSLPSTPTSTLPHRDFMFSSSQTLKWVASGSTFTFNGRNPSPSLCHSNNKPPGLVDQILDYIEGGPKLRKWYGAPNFTPKDAPSKEENESSEARDAVLVSDGDSEIGQMVILSLIVKRVQVKALVKNKQAAVEAFGTYVELMTGKADNKPFLKKVLRGVRAVICPKEGFLSKVARLDGVQHIIFLSQLSVYSSSSGIQAFLKGNLRKLAEEDETVLIASGVPYTIIRVGMLVDTPGGKQGFSFEEGSAAKGSLSKGDAALVCVEALNAVPQTGLIFEVVNGEAKVLSWKEHLVELMGKAG